ncbi:MAG TPA: lipid IV(A) 3-deoxy-D-manno-octulosonic acid transferase [Usitatibacter sp.]|jgi:3-deoxy-D-manno-octulosonic-acid transferase|nr:lipid IV(A) 3-deoxy-D-manno-octulosonic acid transferase [Usitatibacter sp.]
MIRALYALAWLIATPLVLLRLAWRGRRQRGYLENVGERFGLYRGGARGPYVWVHAVSVGETRAAAPLVEALRARYPGRKILVTHMTPTGLATGREAFGDTVERTWLPYDLKFAVRRFLARYRPEVGVIMETEIWPRLIDEAKAAGIPVVLANARLSERSARRYARAPALARWALGNFAGVAAQTGDDAARLAALGARGPVVLGNVKFDLTVPAAMVERGAQFRERFGERSVWVAASTREGEEALLLDAFAACGADPGALLVIVPRHPQRFEEAARLATERGFEVARRSDAGPVPSSARVAIGDSMGEMLAYYAAADVAIIGGTFLDFGGQNLIEACALGRPVIVGPRTYNFEEATRGAVAAGAALRVADAGAAMREAKALAADAPRRESMGAKGLAFVAAHRGAVERLADWIAATAKK